MRTRSLTEQSNEGHLIRSYLRTQNRRGFVKQVLASSTFCLAPVVAGWAKAGTDRLGDTFGRLFTSHPHPLPSHGPKKGLDAIRRWNKIAIDASGEDHAGAREQLGPGRASRAMAIVHIAMFDTVNAVFRGYESYTGLQARGENVSMQAA